MITSSALILVALFLMFLTLILMALLILLTVKQWRAMSQERNEVELAQASLISKSMALLSTTDPLAYQAVQAMEPIRNQPSEEEGVDPLLKIAAEDQADDLMEKFLYGNQELSEEQVERLKREAADRRFLNPADEFVR